MLIPSALSPLHTYQPTNINLLAMIIDFAKLFCLKRTITQKTIIIHLLVITQTAHCSRFCLDAIVRSGYIVESSQGAWRVTMCTCTVSRGRVLQPLIAMAYGAGLRRSGGERNLKCGNLRC